MSPRKGTAYNSFKALSKGPVACVKGNCLLQVPRPPNSFSKERQRPQCLGEAVLWCCLPLGKGEDSACTPENEAKSLMPQLVLAVLDESSWVAEVRKKLEVPSPSLEDARVQIELVA